MRILAICLTFAFAPVSLWAQSTLAAGTPVHVTVTAAHLYGVPRILVPADLTVMRESEPVPISSLTPLRGDHAALELFLLVDNFCNCEPGDKFAELRNFVSSQPAATTIGVAYIRDGKLDITEAAGSDRGRTLGALKAPTGGTPSNPFPALTELIRSFPPDGSRHAVLIITNGIDPAAQEAWPDESAETAIGAAQRAGVTVFAIYHPGADYTTTDYSKIYAGQVQLAHITYESGGEAYFAGFGPLPSLAPFLGDIADHLANQYSLEFLAKPNRTEGELVDVTITSRYGDMDITAPSRVWVAGTPAANPKKPR
ncbi:MAG TPA: hypothetical protein VHC90_19635 [Bryobacteraceae bacterium]|nr:hypothetical protein [Bryobacteraceae bacterium]